MDAPTAARILALAGIESRATQSQNTGNTGGGGGTLHEPAGSSKGGQFTANPSGGGGGYKSILPPDSGYKSAGSGKKKATTAATQGVPQAPTTPRTMKLGDSGEDVRYAQYGMSLLGFNVNQSGEYDQATVDAVKQMQARLGVVKPNGHLTASQLRKIQDAVRLSPCIGAGQRDLEAEAQWEARFAEPDEDDLDEDGLAEAVTDALDEFVARSFWGDWEERAHDVSGELRIPGGVGGGRWTKNPVTAAILAALKAGRTDGDPFTLDGKPIDREPLRKAAVARGIKLPRGASRDDIVAALKADVGKVGGEKATPSAPGPRADAKAKYAAVAQSRPYASAAAAIAELTGKKQSNAVIAEHVRAIAHPDSPDMADAGGTAAHDLEQVAAAFEAGNPALGKRRMSAALKKQGITQGPAGVVPFDPAAHEHLGAASPEAVREAVVKNRILAEYQKLRAGRPDLEFVGLADLRDATPDVSREEFDKAMQQFAGGQFGPRGTRVIPIANRKALKERDHAAAVDFGGDNPRHAFTAANPEPFPLPGAPAVGTPVSVVRPGMSLHRGEGDHVQLSKAVVMSAPGKAASIDAQTRAGWKPGDKLTHKNRGDVTYLGPDTMDTTGTAGSGSAQWVEFADGNAGMVSADQLSGYVPPGKAPAKAAKAAPSNPAEILASLPADLTPAQKRARLRSRGVSKEQIDALVPLKSAKAPRTPLGPGGADDLAEEFYRHPKYTEQQIHDRLAGLNLAELKKVATATNVGLPRDLIKTEAGPVFQPLKKISADDLRKYIAAKIAGDRRLLANDSPPPVAMAGPRPSGLPTDRRPAAGDFEDLANRISGKPEAQILASIQDLNAAELAGLARKFPGDAMLVPGFLKTSDRRQGLKIPDGLTLDQKREWLAKQLANQRGIAWRSLDLDEGGEEVSDLDDDLDDDAYDDEPSPLELQAMAGGEPMDTAARARELALLGITRAAGHDVTPGHDELHHYWTRGPGLAKWAESPKPWTTLVAHLTKYVGPEKAKVFASRWFIEVFHFAAGSDLNRVTHGKPPRGHRVGPG